MSVNTAGIRFAVLAAILHLVVVTGPQAASAAQYTYDRLNRVTEVLYEDGTTLKYSYDEVGNRVSETAAPAVSLMQRRPAMQPDLVRLGRNGSVRMDHRVGKTAGRADFERHDRGYYRDPNRVGGFRFHLPGRRLNRQNSNGSRADHRDFSRRRARNVSGRPCGRDVSSCRPRPPAPGDGLVERTLTNGRTGNREIHLSNEGTGR